MMDNYIKMQMKANLYKRGFVLIKNSERFPEIVSRWDRLDLPDDFVLAYESGNKCTFESFGCGWLCLCGSYCMDVVAGNMDFDGIARNMAQKLARSKSEFLDYLDILNGRFVCIYSREGKIFVLNDAAGTRSVYYCLSKPAFASHYNLLNEIVNSEAEPFYGKYQKLIKKKLSEHKSFPWVMPGDLTPFQDIRLLVPNHEVDLEAMRSVRFWPRTEMPAVNIDAVCDEIACLIKRQAEVLAANYRIFESLTAGFDSRITLAAVKNVADKITFFTYHNPTSRSGGYEINDREQNFVFAKNLCRKEDLRFAEISIIEDAIPADLLEVYKKNHYHVSLPQLLPHYIELFTQGSIHLRANLIETMRDSHVPTNEFASENDIKLFARFMNWNPHDEYYAEACDIYINFFSEYKDSIYDYSGSNLAYWEHRLGSWLSGAVISISDFACDTYQLFNCRRIMGLGLCLPIYYKNRSIIYEKILKRLWPELLDYGLPNESKQLYDFVNKNRVSVLDVGNRLRYAQGNIFVKEHKPNAIYENRGQSISFGFADNKLLKGDYCEIAFDVLTHKDLSYCFQFIIKTFWYQNVKSGGINYQIIIDEKVVYEIATTQFFLPNQILYCFKSDTESTKSVKVRLIATRGFDSGFYCGCLDILMLDAKRDFGHEYSYQPMIVDSYYVLQEKCEDLEYLKYTIKNVGAVPVSNNLPEKEGEDVQGTCLIEKLSIPIIDRLGIEHLDVLRNQLFYDSDINLLSEKDLVFDIETLQSVPVGRFSVVVSGIKFDCVYHPKNNDSLYVILNGSKTSPPPEFKRWSWYTAFEGSMLNIADPSYMCNEKLSLGWYYGTEDLNYRELTAKIIKKIASILQISKIYLYASSGGGAAALHVGGLIENSTVIAINPQIILNLYHYAPQFKAITGIDLALEDKWHRENGAYYIVNSPATKFLLVENISSPDDFIQIRALEKILNKKFSYGLNRFGNVGVWLYDIASKVPHNAQENQILYYAIDRLAKSLEADSGWEKFNSTYIIISEMWRRQILLTDQIGDLKNLLADTKKSE